MKNQNTYHQQTAKFLATVATCIPELSSDVMQELIENPKRLKKVLKEVLCPPERDGVPNEFLKLISDKEIILDATDGSEILADANDLFDYIGFSDFKNWSADEKGSATEETPIAVYEMVKDATFSQVFGSFSANLQKLCFTQAQIKGFAKKYRNWLRADGYGTFFLFKSNSQFFVAYVRVYSNGELLVLVDRLESSSVWRAEYRHRLVLPQLA